MRTLGFVFGLLLCMPLWGQLPKPPTVIHLSDQGSQIADNDRIYRPALYQVQTFNDQVTYISGGDANARPGLGNIFVAFDTKTDTYRAAGLGFKNKVPDPSFPFGSNPAANLLLSFDFYPTDLLAKKNRPTGLPHKGFVLSRGNHATNGVQPASYLYPIEVKDFTTRPPTIAPFESKYRDYSNASMRKVMAADVDKAWAIGNGVIKLFNGEHWFDLSSKTENKSRTHSDVSATSPLSTPDVNPNMQYKGIPSSESFIDMTALKDSPSDEDTLWVLAEKGLIKITYTITSNTSNAHTANPSVSNPSAANTNPFTKKTSHPPPKNNIYSVTNVTDITILSSFDQTTTPSSTPSPSTCTNTNTADNTQLVSGKSLGNGLPVTDGNVRYTAISNVGKDKIWVSTNDGRIYQSTDGGVHFCKENILGDSEIDPEKDQLAFNSISMSGEDMGVAVGNSKGNQHALLYEYYCTTQNGQKQCAWHRINADAKLPPPPGGGVPSFYGITFSSGVPWIVGGRGTIIRFLPDFVYTCTFNGSFPNLQLLPRNWRSPENIFSPIEYDINGFPRPARVPVIRLCSAEVLRCAANGGADTMEGDCACYLGEGCRCNSLCDNLENATYTNVQTLGKVRSSYPWKLLNNPPEVELSIPKAGTADAPNYIERNKVSQTDVSYSFDADFFGIGLSPQYDWVRKDDQKNIRRRAYYGFAKTLNQLDTSMVVEGYIKNGEAKIYDMIVKARIPNFSLNEKIIPLIFGVGRGYRSTVRSYVLQPALKPYLKTPSNIVLTPGYACRSDSLPVLTNTGFAFYENPENSLSRQGYKYILHNIYQRSIDKLPHKTRPAQPRIEFPNGSSPPNPIMDTPLLRNWDKYALDKGSRHNRADLFFTNSRNYINSFTSFDWNFTLKSYAPCEDIYMSLQAQRGKLTCADNTINLTLRVSPLSYQFSYSGGVVNGQGVSDGKYEQLPNNGGIQFVRSREYDERSGVLPPMRFNAEAQPMGDSLFGMELDSRYGYRLGVGYDVRKDIFPKEDSKDRVHYFLLKNEGKSRKDSMALRNGNNNNCANCNNVSNATFAEGCSLPSASVVQDLDSLRINDYNMTDQTSDNGRGCCKVLWGKENLRVLVGLRWSNYIGRAREDTLVYVVDGYEGRTEASYSQRKIRFLRLIQEEAKLLLGKAGEGEPSVRRERVRLGYARDSVDNSGKQVRGRRDSVLVRANVKWYIKTKRKSSNGASVGSNGGNTNDPYGKGFGIWWDTVTLHQVWRKAQEVGPDIPAAWRNKATTGGNTNTSNDDTMVRAATWASPYGSLVFKAIKTNLGDGNTPPQKIQKDSIEVCVLGDSVCSIVEIEQDTGKVEINLSGLSLSYYEGSSGRLCLGGNDSIEVKLPFFLKMKECDDHGVTNYVCQQSLRPNQAQLQSQSQPQPQPQPQSSTNTNNKVCQTGEGYTPNYDEVNLCDKGGGAVKNSNIQRFSYKYEQEIDQPCRSYCVEVLNRNESKERRCDTLKVKLLGREGKSLVEGKELVCQSGIRTSVEPAELLLPRLAFSEGYMGGAILRSNVRLWGLRGYDRSLFKVLPTDGGLGKTFTASEDKEKEYDLSVEALQDNDDAVSLRSYVRVEPMDVCAREREGLSDSFLLKQDSFWLRYRLLREEGVRHVRTRYPLEGVGEFGKEYVLPAVENRYLWFEVESNGSWMVGGRGGMENKYRLLERPRYDDLPLGVSVKWTDTIRILLSSLEDFLRPRRDSFRLGVLDKSGVVHWRYDIHYVQRSYEFGERNVVLYPNPVSSRLYVRSVNGKLGDRGFVFIYDVGGNLIARRPYANGLIDFDFGTLPIGAYIVRVFDGEVFVSKRILRR